MNNFSPPVQSVKTLVLSSLIAVVIAAVLLIIVVLPAEYGIDPTGLGRSMGLTVLSDLGNSQNQQSTSLQTTTVESPPAPDQATQEKTETAAENVVQPLDPQREVNTRYHANETIDIVVPAGKGLEYKFHLLKGETLQYRWTTLGDKLYFDFHGEPQGDTSGYFKSYLVSTENQSQGKFTAPFEGSHGWYWENSKPYPVRVTLVTSGDYDIIGIIKPH